MITAISGAPSPLVGGGTRERGTCLRRLKGFLKKALKNPKNFKKILIVCSHSLSDGCQLHVTWQEQSPRQTTQPPPHTQKPTTEVVGAPPTPRASVKPRPVRAIRPFAKAKGRADQAIEFLRKVPWVLSLSGALLVLFCRQGQKST